MIYGKPQKCKIIVLTHSYNVAFDPKYPFFNNFLATCPLPPETHRPETATP